MPRGRLTGPRHWSGVWTRRDPGAALCSGWTCLHTDLQEKKTKKKHAPPDFSHLYHVTSTRLPSQQQTLLVRGPYIFMAASENERLCEGEEALHGINPHTSFALTAGRAAAAAAAAVEVCVQVAGLMAAGGQVGRQHQRCGKHAHSWSQTCQSATPRHTGPPRPHT